MRLAFFTPLPPDRSGIARYSAELLPRLAGRHAIDVYTSEPPRAGAGLDGIDTFGAHDFVWKHAQAPYDLTVYQLGNATFHDYMWAYLTRWPGLLVLHDGQLHQSRARALIESRREDRYRSEFRFDHPDAPPGVADLGIDGLLANELTYLWPMLRLPVAAARLVAAHGAWFADRLREAFPEAAVEAIRMGVDGPPPAAESPDGAARARGRARLGLQPGEIAFAVLGGMTPEKRLPQILGALAALGDSDPPTRLVLIGAEASHYEVGRDAERLGVRERIVLAGWVDDKALDDCLAAVDICLCLRWPSGSETSASWLRCLAAGRPTVVTDLPQLDDIPTLVIRGTWTPSRLGANADAAPIAVSIDLLDEDRSLAIAMRRLAADAGLRRRLGARARDWWRKHHRTVDMAADYERVLAAAADRSPPSLPRDLLPDGSETTRALVAPFGVAPAGMGIDAERPS